MQLLMRINENVTTQSQQTQAQIARLQSDVERLATRQSATEERVDRMHVKVEDSATVGDASSGERRRRRRRSKQPITAARQEVVR
jgi:TolA-binding protein